MGSHVGSTTFWEPGFSDRSHLSAPQVRGSTAPGLGSSSPSLGSTAPGLVFSAPRRWSFVVAAQPTSFLGLSFGFALGLSLVCFAPSCLVALLLSFLGFSLSFCLGLYLTAYMQGPSWVVGGLSGAISVKGPGFFCAARFGVSPFDVAPFDLLCTVRVFDFGVDFAFVLGLCVRGPSRVVGGFSGAISV